MNFGDFKGSAVLPIMGGYDASPATGGGRTWASLAALEVGLRAAT